MSTLKILSGGAAQGLVGRLAPAFRAETGLDIAGEFGAVGAMADKLRSGVPTDIIVLTATLVAELADEGQVVSASIADVGRVETALAIRTGSPPVVVNDAAALRKAFLDADEIFVPDTRASTAGIHVAKVLDQLGIAGDVANRLRIFPNGATAMRHLADSKAQHPIGCTQATEIISTDGVTLSGSLPPGCELATMYTAAVVTRATAAHPAQRLIDMLTSADARDLRSRAGFVTA